MCETPLSRWAICGVAAGSPRPCGVWGVHAQEPRSPHCWQKALSLACSWIGLTLSPIRPTGAGRAALQGPAGSGPLRPSTLACFDPQPLGPRAASYSLGTWSAMLCSAQGTSFQFFSKKIMRRVWVGWGGRQVLPVSIVTCLLSIEPFPAPSPVLGSGTLKIFRTDGETEVGGEMGAHRRAPSQTNRSREGFLADI